MSRQRATLRPGAGRTGPNRVLRGGSWNNQARNVRAAYRNAKPPDNRWNNAGFRLARAHASARRLARDQSRVQSVVVRYGGEEQRGPGVLVALLEAAVNARRVLALRVGAGGGR